jgi:hypothetical protein
MDARSANFKRNAFESTVEMARLQAQIGVFPH